MLEGIFILCMYGSLFWVIMALGILFEKPLSKLYDKLYDKLNDFFESVLGL